MHISRHPASDFGSSIVENMVLDWQLINMVVGMVSIWITWAKFLMSL